MTPGGPNPPSLPARSPESHKGDFGRVLVIAGSLGLTGAAVLTGEAALRSGAGLVTVATARSQQPILATKIASPCMTAALPDSPEGFLTPEALEPALELAEARDVVALGPGIGSRPATRSLVRTFLERLDRPCVLDADGLTAMAGHVESLQGSAPRILTPHPGEMAQLLERSTAEVQADREAAARHLAARSGAVVVLKGAGTVITAGDRLVVHPLANPGLATGGTGDVLTGVVTALLGQGLEPFDAAWLGVIVHARAGQLAREQLGEVSMTAADVLDRLPDAFLLES
ncbi:MAG: NAD(P)H-hydrate dehydratase [Planctomycetota bacterium]